MLFSEVIGQEAVKEKLVISFREGRVSHALLFFGPVGSGVLPLARAFAQYITCEQPVLNDSCGQCSACKKNAKMVHPDVHYVYPVATSKKNAKPKSVDYVSDWRTAALANPYLDYNDWVEIIAESENKQASIMVEEAHDIIHKINLKAFEAPYKVIIIWLPERMRVEVANKLLKSLEEPPDNTVFILASEQRDQLLQTILSRTQLVKLARLTDDEIAQAIGHQFSLSPEKLIDISRLSDGNFHTAFEMAGQELGEERHEEAFINWMRFCFNPQKSTEKLLNWVDTMAAGSRDKQKQFLFSCIQVLRECLLLNFADNSMVKIDNAQQQSIVKFLPFVNENNAEPFVEALNEAHFHVERNANPKILFLDLSLKVSRILQIK
jgi:DNA polymerase III subunit delta'